MSKNILLVDDNQKIRELFTSYLELKGFNVDSLDSGVEVMNKIESNDYDIVLLDMAMPQVSGFEVLVKMNEKQFDMNKVIVLTAADLSDEEKEKIKSFQIRAFLEKPAELSTIMGLIGS